MYTFAADILFFLGATTVRDYTSDPDPTTEEEFSKLNYESPIPITWQQYQEAYNNVVQKKAVDALRVYRSRILRETDWILTVDNWESLVNKEEWRVYRQFLRDLPALNLEYKWKKNGILDIENMNLLVQPAIIRSTPS